MTLTAGAITEISVSGNQAQLSVAAATGGVGPYTYQWYRSTSTGFTPGAGSLISGATALTLSDTGLIPLTTYYYKVVSTDTGASNDTVTSSQEAVTTTGATGYPNAFSQSPTQGQIDMRFPYNTISVQIDSSQSTALYAGSAVEMVDSAGGVPKVIGVTDITNEVLGFLNFDVKSVEFNAGDMAEMSMAGNVIFLYSGGAVARGEQVTLGSLTFHPKANVVVSSTGETGSNIVGWSLDKAAGAGELIRVFLKTPSFTVV